MGALASEPIVVGRYALFDVIASGGMATVHLGRLIGPVGFSRTVAIKRLHVGYARDPEFVSMFLDEARLAARIQHPNVVQTVDVVATKGELFLVMDYVQGESLSRLLRLLSEGAEEIPIRIAVSILSGMLQGLHAAHTAKDEHGLDLGIVHRDVSPQNVLVGVDGMARVLDFGIAKAAGRMQTTRDGQVKGKLAYMAPEQVHGETLARTADVYAAGVVAWEVLTGKRLFKADNETTVLAKVLAGVVSAPSTVSPRVTPALDEVVLRSLARDPAERFQTAKEMSLSLERALPPASLADVAEWLAQIAGPALTARALLVAKVETDSGVSSIESLKKRMVDELGANEPREDEALARGEEVQTSTKLGIGASAAPAPPVVRSTVRLESAAKQALARLAAEESAKSSRAPIAQVVAALAPAALPFNPPRAIAPSQPNVPAVAITQRNDVPRSRARAAMLIAIAIAIMVSASVVVTIIVVKRGARNDAAAAAIIPSAPTTSSTAPAISASTIATSEPSAIASAPIIPSAVGSDALTSSSPSSSASLAPAPTAHRPRHPPTAGTAKPPPGEKDPFDLGGRL